MSKVVVSVEMDDSLKIVKEIFDNAGFHHLIVLDELGKLFGVISDRDLLRSISPYLNTPAETPRDLATLNKKAHQILTRKPISLPATAEIIEAIASFIPYGIGFLVLVLIAISALKGAHIYIWMDPQYTDITSHHYDPIIGGKSAYLNMWFFWLRTIVYLGIYYWY